MGQMICNLAKQERRQSIVGSDRIKMPFSIKIITFVPLEAKNVEQVSSPQLIEDGTIFSTLSGFC